MALPGTLLQEPEEPAQAEHSSAEWDMGGTSQHSSAGWDMGGHLSCLTLSPSRGQHMLCLASPLLSC